MRLIEFDQLRFCDDLRGVVKWHGKGVWAKTRKAGISNGNFGRALNDSIIRDIATIATLCHLFELDMNKYLIRTDEPCAE